MGEVLRVAACACMARVEGKRSRKGDGLVAAITKPADPPNAVGPPARAAHLPAQGPASYKPGRALAVTIPSPLQQRRPP